MIKANELRIGNWLQFDNMIQPSRRIKVNARFFSSLASGKAEQELKDDEPINEYYQPIPITPEILDKAGFKKVHTELEPVAFTYSLEIPVEGDNKNEIHFTVVKMGNSESHGNYLVNDHWASNNFKYLHQLQNLYFALTGEELTVNFKELTYQ